MSTAAPPHADRTILLTLEAGRGQRVEWSIGDIAACLRDLGVQRPLVVLSEQAIRSAGLQKELQQTLQGYDASTFDAFTPNPEVDEAIACAHAAIGHRADALVGVGGGSCLDVAKLAALVVPQIDAARDILTNRAQPTEPALPVIAVPTTIGTGSEATPFAAIYDQGRKHSAGSSDLLPRSAILEARFAATMPAKLAAQTSLDALCQAIESTWAVGATNASLQAASLALERIVPAIHASAREADPAARAAMQIGAHLAGRAIAISKTTAAHAMSYELTQRFGLAHGHAVALTLGALAAFNAQVTEDDCLDPRGPASVRTRVGSACAALGVTPSDMPEAMRTLMADLGLEPSLSAVGVSSGDAESLAAAADPVRLSNNPRRLTTADIRSMYQTSL